MSCRGNGRHSGQGALVGVRSSGTAGKGVACLPVRGLGADLVVPEPSDILAGARTGRFGAEQSERATEPAVNVVDGLQRIRERLEENGADSASIQAVDQIMRRAALPAAAPASATSLLQLVRMLMRTPAANNNVRVYNEFVRLEEEMSTAAAAYRERQAAEGAMPVPKTKKYYKDLRERERKTQAGG